MNYVEIDIVNPTHIASALSSDDEELIKLFPFFNDNDGLQPLISKLKSLVQDNFIIALESSAHYVDNLVR